MLDTGGLQLNTRDGAQDPQGLLSRLGEEARRRQHAERAQVGREGGTTGSMPHASSSARNMRRESAARQGLTRLGISLYCVQELVLQDVMEASQRPLVLGLAAVRRDPALSAAQASSCLSRLLMLHPQEHHTVTEALRGQELYIGRQYGLTREGAISLPWDWAVRPGSNRR